MKWAVISNGGRRLNTVAGAVISSRCLSEAATNRTFRQVRVSLWDALKHTLSVACLVLAFSATAAPDFAELQGMFKENCNKCHGEEKQKGKVRFDTLKWDLTDGHSLELWQEALDQLETGDMPPDDEEPLMSETLRKEFVGKLKSTIASGIAAQKPAETVLRRMNRVQYANAIHDLFGIDPTSFDLMVNLPVDDLVSGSDSVGRALRVSEIHLDAYFATANQIFTILNEKRVESSELDVMNDRQFRMSIGPAIRTADGNAVDIVASAWTNRRFTMMQINGSNGHGGTVSESGRYRVRIECEALHVNDQSAIDRVENLQAKSIDGSNLVVGAIPQLAFFLRRSSRAYTPRIERLLATRDLLPGAKREIEVEAWLPKGSYSLAFNYENGPKGRPLRFAVDYLMKHEPDALITKEAKIAAAKVKGAGAKLKGRESAAVARYFQQIETPRIRVHRITLEGPLQDETQALYERAVFGDPNESLVENVRHFAERAYRRPVTRTDIASLVEGVRVNGDEKQSYQNAVKAILCSPNFLYLREKPGRLDGFALADRLALLLWNGLPDTTLRQAAAGGKLESDDQLRLQVKRMLGDAKSDDFVRHFVHNWLGLQQMSDMPPDKTVHPNFYQYFVADLMARESESLFRHLLRENLSVGDFLAADYTFLNDRLARFYGLPEVKGGSFQKVSLPKESNRAGLFGHGAVLASSANGVDTSPVLRGIWVMERILGTPPAHPPEDLEIPEPDTRGSLSLRDFYERHRTDKSCYSCHKDIDPLGFALENFDPVGLWRTTYESGETIDASGVMPDGKAFDGVEGFQKIMSVQKTEMLARNLLKRLLVCGSGRELTVVDQPEIDRIMAELKSEGYRFGDLLEQVVLSSIFRSK